MKIFIGSMIIAVSGIAAHGQTQPIPPTTDVTGRLMAELAAAKPSSIKNAPFSGEEVSESVQTLFDGNRIVRSSTGKIYRNSEGRVRRESANGNGGFFGTTFSYGRGVSIIDPRVNEKYLLDEKLKTARVVELTNSRTRDAAVAAEKAVVEERRTRELANLAAKLKTDVKPTAPVAMPQVSVGHLYGQAVTIHNTRSGSSKYDTRTEELGTRDFEGVSAEGTRRTTIIPAGAIGNDRQIEVVYERWYSKELGMVVYSKNTDPRFGEQTYQLKNIVRTEPDPSLFSIPSKYRRITPTSPYRVTYATGRSSRSRTGPAKASNVSSSAKAGRP